jgi:YVTN family beta-propeller protein
MEFLILGPLEVRDGEKTVRLGAAKQRALLGVLLLHPNETVSTSRLVDELWGETPPATAEKLVQGYVHALRKQLGDGVLETRAPGYRIVLASRSLDLAEFERLSEEARAAPLPQSVEVRRRALRLWRGPPLADVELEGPGRHALARLAELRLATQIEQIDAELALGRHAQIVGEVEALAALHPYQERLHAQLMLALYRSGRQADALEAYRRLRSRLDEELGLQPGQELRDLEAAILRQDESLDVRAASGAPPTSARDAPAAPQEAPEVRGRITRRRALLGAGMVVGVGFAALALALLRGDPAPIVVPADSVAAIDPATNRVTAVVPTGIRPGPVASGAGSIWVGNLDDGSLTRVDRETKRAISNISLPSTPTAVTFARGAVWVVDGRLGVLYRVNPRFETVSDPVEMGDRSIRHAGAGVDVGEGAVWAAFGDSTIARVDPAATESSVGSTDPGPAALVVAFGSVWVASSATVQRFAPRTFRAGPTEELTVGRSPSGMAAGVGAVWVACTGDDYVARVAASLTGSSSVSIPVGDGPSSVAVGAGAVWVANTAAGTVSRIDPATNGVETIDVGNAPAGIAVAGGLVWVSVQEP